MSTLLRPAPFFQYKKEEEILHFTNELSAELVATVQFSILISEVENHPKVYGLAAHVIRTDRANLWAGGRDRY